MTLGVFPSMKPILDTYYYFGGTTFEVILHMRSLRYERAQKVRGECAKSMRLRPYRT